MMTDYYAVIGNPIAHSKSPLIHAAFAEQTAQDIQYARLLSHLDSFSADVQEFFATSGKGLNVTVPFKGAAAALADELSETAQRAHAVNTLSLKNGRLHGDNTDGIGLVRDLLQRHQFDFDQSRLLILGAGGAAHGVVPSLLQTGLASLTIANRTASKAYALVSRFESAIITACGLDELVGQVFDLIINATAAGLQNQLPPLPTDCLASDGWVYDMLYANQPTLFMRWGEQQGAAKTLDGLGMLVEQAAESFYLWRGIKPETQPIYQTLRTTE